jgi:hypothetical protein
VQCRNRYAASFRSLSDAELSSNSTAIDPVHKSPLDLNYG